MEKTKILMIDDEQDFCKLVKMNLEQVGDYEVRVISNSKQGIKLAKKEKPDLILLDIMMPGVDGFKVLEVLKKDSATMAIPVVMLTAQLDDESKLKAMQLFDEGYLTKPIDTYELKTKIDEVLRRSGRGV